MNLYLLVRLGLRVLVVLKELGRRLAFDLVEGLVVEVVEGFAAEVVGVAGLVVEVLLELDLR